MVLLVASTLDYASLYEGLIKTETQIPIMELERRGYKKLFSQTLNRNSCNGSIFIWLS